MFAQAWSAFVVLHKDGAKPYPLPPQFAWREMYYSDDGAEAEYIKRVLLRYPPEDEVYNEEDQLTGIQEDAIARQIRHSPEEKDVFSPVYVDYS